MSSTVSVPAARSSASPPIDADRYSVSIAMRLVGDRWSLLLVRELAIGNNRFSEIQSALPDLSRSLLATRLRYLERIGLITREPVPGDGRSPHQYALTEAGWGLKPVLATLGQWSQDWFSPAQTDDRDDVHLLLSHVQESVERSVLPDGRISIRFLLENGEDAVGWMQVDQLGSRWSVGYSDTKFDLTVKASTGVLSDLWWRRRRCADALTCHDIMFDGPTAYAQAFSTWFPHRPVGPVADNASNPPGKI